MSTTALAVVLAKLSGLGVGAKAAVGLAVAAGAVGVTAAAPAVADLVDEQVVVADEAATPTEEATEQPTTEPTTDPTSDPTAVPTEDPTADPTEPADGWQDAETFGAWVRTQAREGGVDGQEIAAAAQERNQVRAAERTGDAAGDVEQTCEGDGTCDGEQTCEGDGTCDGEPDQVRDRDQDGSDDGDQGTSAPGRSGEAPGRNG